MLSLLANAEGKMSPGSVDGSRSSCYCSSEDSAHSPVVAIPKPSPDPAGFSFSCGPNKYPSSLDKGPLRCSWHQAGLKEPEGALIHQPTLPGLTWPSSGQPQLPPTIQGAW